jgi:hypothetical protein
MLVRAAARRLAIRSDCRLEPAELDADGVQDVGRKGRDRDRRGGLFAVLRPAPARAAGLEDDVARAPVAD